MFDIGFIEIIIICLVGLVVIGPKRLPEALRAGAMWMGRGKRMLGNVRRELEDELGLDEIRRDLRNEQIMAEIKAENLEEGRERQNQAANDGSTPETQAQPEADAQPRPSTRKPQTNNYLDSAKQNGQPPPTPQNEIASSTDTAVQATASKPKE